MALNAAHWTVTRATGAIRYTGPDHGGGASYATVIEFHRWLQGLADDAVAVGNDELDITNTNPSQRSTDNIITLINGYNIDDPASEHLYDGSIIQGTAGSDIYDGIVNFGNADVQIQIIQNGAVITDDWWNLAGAGLNPDATAGISHRFMIQTKSGGTDIDGRRLIGTCRRFNYTYSEFSINGTARGNNVLALTDSTDLNNQTAIGDVAAWTFTNLAEGYNAMDVNNDGSNEYYYSKWDIDTGVNSINDFYERMKWISRDSSATTTYGINGELFRGITHQVAYTSLTGTFDDSNPVSWGVGAGTGQIIADNGTNAMWIQVLTGTAPTTSDSLSQTVPDAASATAGTVTERTISKPFCGQSTGSAIIGAYGVGINNVDLTASDKVTSLAAGAPISPPNNVTNTVSGLISGEDRVLVAPWDGATYDSNNDPAINKTQLSLATALAADNVIAVVVTEAIPDYTPASGFIRVTDDDGFERRLIYTAVNTTTKTFTIDPTASEVDVANVADFGGAQGSGTYQASIGNDIYIAYIDELVSGTTASFTSVHATSAPTMNLVLIVRDGGGTPIKPTATPWSQGDTSSSTIATRTGDT